MSTAFPAALIAPAVVPVINEDAPAPALPGVTDLVVTLRPLCRDARARNAAAHLAAWRVMALVHAHAQRADVQAKVYELNHLPDGRVRPGRPRAAHRLIIEALARDGVFCSESGKTQLDEHRCLRTLDGWHAEWRAVAPALGLEPGDSHALFSAWNDAQTDLAERVDAALDKAHEFTARAAADAGQERPDPAALARQFTGWVARHLLDGDGRPRLRGRNELTEFAQAVEAQFESLGLGLVVTVAPKGHR